MNHSTALLTSDLPKRGTVITTLFLDIDGVLLNDGWDHQARNRAATHFQLNFIEMEKQHQLSFSAYENGMITLQDYLDHVVFYENRPFTQSEFQEFMFEQSQSYPEMIELIRQLKEQYGLKIVAICNEARELNLHRIRKFGLVSLVDEFVSFRFINLPEPDALLFRLAFHIDEKFNRHGAYIENTPLLLQKTEDFGLRSMFHSDYQSTCSKLAELGLEDKLGLRQSTHLVEAN